MRDILTTALERSIDAQMEESRKRGLSLKEMKEGKSIEEKRAEALDLISEKKPNPFPQWNSIGEALERARGDKS
tara:strand:- start:143 stop:364 length:222 start_codon:yes stop_codon:yes gene_type:complete